MLPMNFEFCAENIKTLMSYWKFKKGPWNHCSRTLTLDANVFILKQWHSKSNRLTDTSTKRASFFKRMLSKIIRLHLAMTISMRNSFCLSNSFCRVLDISVILRNLLIGTSFSSFSIALSYCFYQRLPSSCSLLFPSSSSSEDGLNAETLRRRRIRQTEKICT